MVSDHHTSSDGRQETSNHSCSTAQSLSSPGGLLCLPRLPLVPVLPQPVASTEDSDPTPSPLSGSDLATGLDGESGQKEPWCRGDMVQGNQGADP